MLHVFVTVYNVQYKTISGQINISNLKCSKSINRCIAYAGRGYALRTTAHIVTDIHRMAHPHRSWAINYRNRGCFRARIFRRHMAGATRCPGPRGQAQARHECLDGQDSRRPIGHPWLRARPAPRHVSWYVVVVVEAMATRASLRRGSIARALSSVSRWVGCELR
jgi:hypothetical protein